MPNNTQRFRTRSKWPERIDVLYFVFLLMIVTSSAAFPFYVHFHRDQFGPPEMRFYGATGNGELIQAESPIYQRNIVAQVKPRLELDRITTASIRPGAKELKKPRLQFPARQPFPEEQQISDSTIEILFVTPERLLAVENGRVTSFRKGSLLADGSRITEIKKSAGKWIIETSGGTSMNWAPPQ